MFGQGAIARVTIILVTPASFAALNRAMTSPSEMCPELGFVHFVDRMGEAGYRGLTPHLPERVSHGSPAERDCTRPAGIRGRVQRARVGLGAGAGSRGNPD